MGAELLQIGVANLSQFVVNGLLVGALFAGVAVGFALIWGVVDIINLAHGEMVMLGGYVTWFTLSELLGLGTVGPALALATIPVSVAVLFGLGYVLQRALVSRVTGTDLFLTLLVTFGLSIMLQQIAIRLFSPTPRTVNVVFAGGPSLLVGPLVVPKVKLVAFLGAIALTVALYGYLTRTRQGRAIRSVAQNPEAAALVGIDVEHTRALTFGLSSAIAGGVGSFVAMVVNIQPQMGLVYTLKSFVIVVFGGIGSVPGALVGGLLLGTVEELTAGIVSSKWTLAVSFSLLVVLLVLRPQGLFGDAMGGE